MSRRICSRLIAFLILFAPFSAFGQGAPIKPVAPTLERKVDFQSDVLPMLQVNCIACHNKTTNENELVLETVGDILKGGSTGPSVVPGEPDNSLLYKVAARSEEPVMPPLPNEARAKALTPKQLGLLRQWITEGAEASMRGATKSIAWKAVNSRFKAVYSLDYHDRTGTLAASRSNRVDLYNLHSKRAVGTLVDPGLEGRVAHHDIVQSVAFHPTKAILATGGYRSVKFWERDSALVARTVLPEAVSVVAADSNGKHIGIGVKSQLQVWGGTGNADVRNIGKHEHPIVAIAFGSGSVFSADQSGRVKQWKLSDATLVSEVEFETSPTCLQVVGAHIVVGVGDGRLLVRSHVEPAVKFELQGHTGRVHRIVPVDAATILTASHDKTIRVWNAATKKLVRTINVNESIADIAISPSKLNIAAITDGRRVLVWNRATGNQITVCSKDLELTQQTQQAVFQKTAFDRQVNFRTARVSATNKEVQTQTKTLVTAKATVEKARKTLAEAVAKKSAEAQKILDAEKRVKAKPDDKGQQKQVQMLRKGLTKVVDAIKNATKSVAAAEKDVTIIEAGLARARSTLADEQSQLKLRVAERDKIVADLGLLKAKVEKFKLPVGVGVRFDSDDCVVASYEDGTLRTWNAASGEPQSVVSSEQMLASVQTFDSGSIALSPDGRTIVRLTSTPEWKLVGSLGSSDLTGRVRALAFSPDGTRLAVAGGRPSRSGQLQVRDADSRALLHDCLLYTSPSPRD